MAADFFTQPSHRKSASYGPDENEKEWGKIVATYKNNKENREKIRTTEKYKRKRYTIEGKENTMGNSNELRQTQKKKAKTNIIITIKKGKNTENRTKERLRENRIRT